MTAVIVLDVETTGKERGRAYSVAQLVRRGAPRPHDGEDLATWLAEWLPQLTRPRRHPGCLRYVWCLNRRRRGEVLRFAAVPYPKLEDLRGEAGR